MQFVVLGVLLAFHLVHMGQAKAIIVARDPGRNLRAPDGRLQDSGWQFQGEWNGSSATAVGPHHFITAAHVGGHPGGVFTYRGVAYRALCEAAIPNSGLAVWRVAGTFPTWAEIYRSGSELHHTVILFGRGGRRGGDYIKGNARRGWLWEPPDGQLSWGMSYVAKYADEGQVGNQDSLLLLPFLPHDGPNAGCASPGDSGGGVFVRDTQDGEKWKLAGILSSVTQFLESDTGLPKTVNACLFDTRGACYYTKLGKVTCTPLDGDARTMPSMTSYAPRISYYASDIDQAIRATNSPIQVCRSIMGYVLVRAMRSSHVLQALLCLILLSLILMRRRKWMRRQQPITGSPQITLK